MNFVLNLVSILFEAISVAFIMNVTLRIINKGVYKDNLLKVLYTTPILLSVFILNLFITFYAPSLICMKVFIFISVTPFIFIYIYKTNILKGMCSVLIYLIISALINILVAVVAKALGIDPMTLISNQTYRAITLIIIATLELFVGVVSYTLLDILKSKLSFNSSASKYIIPQLIAVAFCMLPTMILLMLNYFKYSALFISINFLQLLAISIVGLYNSKNVIKQDLAETELANTIVHNDTLIKVNEGVRGFKHDMANIVQSILGYVALNDTKGIKEYCQNLVIGFNDINVLSILSPEVINNPAIYGVVVNKILVAREKNMELSIDVTTIVEDINFPKFELSRVLGILLDNAIESGENTTARKLIFTIYRDYKKGSDVISISNSVSDTNIDIANLFKKGNSTKPGHSGFGLYIVKEIVRRQPQATIKTHIDSEEMLFTQTIIITNKNRLDI